MWDQKTLEQTIGEKMGDYRLIIASNRQPYRHILKAGKLICQREPGGLVTALDPVMQTAHGTWVAVGTSEQDKQSVDSHKKVRVPPENQNYTLRRIFLTKEEHDAYYFGYANEGLWPLCHVAYARPVFLETEWQAYQKVNRMFADAILEEIGDEKAFVWIQDFHLMLVAKYLREANRPNIITSFFLHVPWPNPEIFRICPQKTEILEGLLSHDLLGFQIRYHADNFLAAVDRELESRIDREKVSITYQNKETLVRAFPISVDFETISAQAVTPSAKERGLILREELSLGDKRLIVGVDRLDYTKGIPERLRAIDRFLELYPETKEQFIFLQMGQISRIHVPRYKQLNDEINGLVEEINWKHSQGGWAPIVLSRAYMSYQDILAIYAMADICIVSSLHDGMNLVAKEFVSARSDLAGVLLLSQFTGAARELTDALLINPYDIEAFARTLHQAYTMPADEQESRMRKMRELTCPNNIYRWAGKVLSQLLKFEFHDT